MMGLPSLFILDVGHGSCAVLDDRNGAGIYVFDAGSQDSLLLFLEQQRINTINAVFITHADSDHIEGLIALLGHQEITVKQLYINPDSGKQTQIWEDLRYSLKNFQPTIQVITALTTTSDIETAGGDIKIEVLAPDPITAMSGPGGRDLQGRSLDSNRMSAVIRIMQGNKPKVLLTGDMDAVGLDNLLDGCPLPQAQVLVFPHHGGSPRNRDEVGFARTLCNRVRPNLVVFSIGRNKTATPRPDIVQGVQASHTKPHIACTQLSQQCSAMLPAEPLSHLSDEYARGRKTQCCCAGTIRVMLHNGDTNRYQPCLESHAEFVDLNAPTALCKRQINTPIPGSDTVNLGTDRVLSRGAGSENEQ